MKTIYINANERTRIISRFSNSIPTTYRFKATCTDSNNQPSGTVEIKGSNWLFPKPPVTMELKADNTVSKTAWDTFYNVYVTPSNDVNITLETRQMNRPLIYFALAAGIAAVAISLMVFGLGR